MIVTVAAVAGIRGVVRALVPGRALQAVAAGNVGRGWTASDGRVRGRIVGRGRPNGAALGRRAATGLPGRTGDRAAGTMRLAANSCRSPRTGRRKPERGIR